MTKILTDIVRCIKCGKTSEQMQVMSVNFNLGTKESNEKLMNHMQKCPHCGYEAPMISEQPKNTNM